MSRLIDVFGGDSNLRFNDGRCDRAGRFWAGSMPYDLSPGHGALFTFEPDWSVERIVEGTWLANGLDWSPDDRLFYLVDTLHHVVDVFDFDLDDGSLGGRRRFVDVDPIHGNPDGLTVDAEGCVWVALYGGGGLHRYTPSGRLDTIVDVPGVSHVTSPGFGGHGLDVLYITTAWEDLGPRERILQPRAGNIFRVVPGASGQPTSSFAG